MGRQKQNGFTIIEVILFLAISSLLLVALFVGINTSINQQRYKDSVVSFIGLLQEQYSLTSNVNNQRDTRWTCDAEAPKISQVADNSRGTTDCVIIGRVVQIKNGTTIITSNIVAYNINDELLKTATSDIQVLTGAMSLVSLGDAQAATVSEVSSRDMEWGARVKLLDGSGSVAGSGTAATIAIIRSPVTGTVGTYVVNEETQDWKNKIITQESRTRQAIACVDAGVVLAGPRQAVIVSAGAANSGGVYQRSEVLGC